MNVSSHRAALTPSAPLALMPPPSSGLNQPVAVSRLQMQLHLQDLQQNTNALRKQLSQLRNIQVGLRTVVTEKNWSALCLWLIFVSVLFQMYEVTKTDVVCYI